MPLDLDTASALDLAASIRSGQVSPSEVMEATLAAIDARNRALNAVIWLDEDDARARARAATERIAAEGADGLPPFFGVPLPVKDLTPVAGQPCTLGSAGAGDEPAEETALVIERLVDAGFLLCGRTNSPEFGTITATENPGTASPATRGTSTTRRGARRVAPRPRSPAACSPWPTAATAAAPSASPPAAPAWSA